MRRRNFGLGLPLALMIGRTAAAQTPDPGVTDTEIKLGQTMPYSGPLSSYGTIGNVQTAYFEMINKQGGVNGRKITLISLDDGYNPARTIERVRELVENERVLLTFMTMGTATNSAIQKYMNSRKIPMLFLASGASKWNDPEHFPWTMGWPPSYRVEGRVFAKYILKNVKDPKIGVLYQNDDLGKDFMAGFRETLGADADKLIVKQETYEVTDPTIDSQLFNLKASGATVFFDVTVSRFATQAIKRISEIGWSPLHLLINNSNSITGTLAPAGLDKAKGIITPLYLKDVADPEWKPTPEVQKFLSFMHDYYPAGDPNDVMNAYGYSGAQAMVHVLEQCGGDLSRANVMKQASNIHDLTLPLLLPGISVNTGKDNLGAISEEKLARFDGERWVLLNTVTSD
jgi:branched-chain amino acid transport system substrate-binding protein